MATGMRSVAVSPCSASSSSSARKPPASHRRDIWPPACPARRPGRRRGGFLPNRSRRTPSRNAPLSLIGYRTELGARAALMEGLHGPTPDQPFMTPAHRRGLGLHISGPNGRTSSEEMNPTAGSTHKSCDPDAPARRRTRRSPDTESARARPPHLRRPTRTAPTIRATRNRRIALRRSPSRRRGLPEEPAKFAGLLADRLARTVWDTPPQPVPPHPRSRVLHAERRQRVELVVAERIWAAATFSSRCATRSARHRGVPACKMPASSKT
jgi:hypothetical protein